MSLLGGCHLMLTEETWFEVGRCGGGQVLAPAAQAGHPHRLPGGGWRYVCDIFSSKWESL